MKESVVKGFIGTLLVWSLLSSHGSEALTPARHAARHPAIRFHIVRTEQWFRKHRVNVLLAYPVVTGLPNPSVQVEVNQLLRDAYPPGGLAAYLRPQVTTLDPGEGIHLDGTSSVKLLRGHIMSVYYEGMDYLTRHGKFIGAYPNNLYSSVTVDLRAGRVVHLRDLFRRSDWRKKLDNLIVREVHRTVPELDTASIREAVAAHRYNFYLTSDNLHIFNIFDVHALSGAQVDISRRAL
ncbi:MAG: hypothetical protein M3Y56_00590 [Armatimonadota bacterium]|nr:hypothetical protein [Armatimonadota bacterium]